MKNHLPKAKNETEGSESLQCLLLPSKSNVFWISVAKYSAKPENGFTVYCMVLGRLLVISFCFSGLHTVFFFEIFFEGKLAKNQPKSKKEMGRLICILQIHQTDKNNYRHN